MASVPEIDHAAIAGRFHQWAFYCPELGQRIDAMLLRLDYSLSTSDGRAGFWSGGTLRTRAGRDVSTDWLICGETYPTSPTTTECRPRNAESTLLRDFGARSIEQQAGLLEMVRAMTRRDYAAARHWVPGT